MVHFMDKHVCVSCGVVHHVPTSGKNPRSLSILCESCWKKEMEVAASKDASASQSSSVSQGRKASS